MEDITYRPQTAATRTTFDSIIIAVANNLDDVPHEVVCSAADAVLEYLKDDDMKGLNKKRGVDDILGLKSSSKQWSKSFCGPRQEDHRLWCDDEENNPTA